MISALKITADRMALCGVARCMMFSAFSAGIGGGEGGRDDGEVLGHVVGDAEGGQRAARHQQLLADLHDLDELGRVGVEVDHVARLPWPPGCRCSSPRRRRPGPARGRRWCRRRSWPPGGRRPASRGCSFSLASGVAWARKSSTPASAAMAAAVSGLSPVIITVLMPMRRSSAKRSWMPPLTMSLRWMTPSTCAPSATTSGVPPSWAIAVHAACDAGGELAALLRDVAPRWRRRRPCGSRGRRGSTPLMRVWAVNGTNVAPSALHVAPAQAVLLLGQHDDAAPLRRLVGQRGELRGVGQLSGGSRPAPG